jgi:hypothetical protein
MITTYSSTSNEHNASYNVRSSKEALTRTSAKRVARSSWTSFLLISSEIEIHHNAMNMYTRIKNMTYRLVHIYKQNNMAIFKISADLNQIIMSFTVEAKLTENMSTSLLIGTQKSD